MYGSLDWPRLRRLGLGADLRLARSGLANNGRLRTGLVCGLRLRLWLRLANDWPMARRPTLPWPTLRRANVAHAFLCHGIHTSTTYISVSITDFSSYCSRLGRKQFAEVSIEG